MPMLRTKWSDNFIEATRETIKAQPALLARLPDVQIFHNAVRYALTYDHYCPVKLGQS